MSPNATKTSAITGQGRPVDQVGFTTTVFAQTEFYVQNNNGKQSLTEYAICPAGSSVVGGGYSVTGDPVIIEESIPYKGQYPTDAWRVTATIDPAAWSASVHIWAACAK